MSIEKRVVVAACLAIVQAVLLAACDGGGGAAPPPPLYTIGGSISGLTADGLVLANGADTVSPASGATSFQFSMTELAAASYSVTLSGVPPSLICSIAHGSGSVGQVSVSNIAVTCAARSWVWKAGSSSINSQGSYGDQGFPAPANAPAGRHEVASWVDGAGNFWLFGGEAGGVNGAAGVSYPNDLWKFNPSSGEWTWMNGSTAAGTPAVYGVQGVASAANVPGGRHWSSSWVDAGGNFWLFGGIGYDGSGMWGLLNDLWEYQPQTDEWTWISGSQTAYALSVYGAVGVASGTAVPGARSYAVTWTDVAGNLWLYGGFGDEPSGQTRGLLSEIWKFSPISAQWTLVSGDGTVDDPSVYGTQGVASVGNTPGGRAIDGVWQTASGDIWMFGGECNQGYCNDLWSYSPSTGAWTWTSGSNTAGAQNAYGTLGVDSATSVPGARTMSASWIDQQGNLWLFGGYGYDSSMNLQLYNDLWEFRASSQHWIWISGSSSGNSAGTYGTLGVAASANTPGARIKPASWTDATGQLWLFGGSGYDGAGALGFLNDIWAIHSN